MLRYLRLVLGIGVLAAIYWQIGGFGPMTGESTDSREPAPTTEATADTVAAGGPDDGPSFGYPPLDHENDLERVRRSVPMSEIEEWDELVIGRNESFYVALRRAGLDHDTIMRVVDAAEPHADLSRVRRGDRFLLAHDDDDDSLRAIRFDVRDENYVVIDLSTEEPRTEL